MRRRSSRSFLPPSLATREQARRRLLLVSIGALTILSTSPVLGHHLARGADQTFLQGTDRIGELCLVALHILLAPVHGLFHVLLLVGLAYATRDRIRAWGRARHILRPLDQGGPLPGDPIWTAAIEAGIDPLLVRVVAGLPNPAFTVGWFAPRVYVALELVERLNSAELAAVLAHEAAHVARRDPLRLSVLRFFALTLFWIPALKRLADDVADEAEVLADDHAAGDEPLVLAAAILSVAAWPTRMVAIEGAVGITCQDILERRVRRLAGEDTSCGTHVTRRSIAAAAAALALVWTSGVVVAHPLDAHAGMSVGAHGQRGGTPLDCLHHEGLVLLHLFCDGISLGGAHYRCPHASA